MGSVPESVPVLRGDYSKAGLDYSVEQDWDAYTPEERSPAPYARTPAGVFVRPNSIVNQ